MINKLVFLLTFELLSACSIHSMELSDAQESVIAIRKRFCKAAAENDLDKVTQMYYQHYDWNHHPDLDGIITKGAAHDVCKSHYAALYNAVKCGNYEATKFLLKTDGIKISLRYDSKRLFHIVCFGKWHEDEEKHNEILKEMLDADVNRYVEKDGNSIIEGTPLDVAVNSGAPKSIQDYLFRNGAKHVLYKIS